MIKRNPAFIIVVLFVAACTDQPKTLFVKLSSSETNIDFQNAIIESTQNNILTNEYLYNGGGIGVGDFNNDGLSDLVFTANLSGSKIYLNQGNFSFTDISES